MYTKMWLVAYTYGGFGVTYLKGDTIEEALLNLPKTHKYVSHELYSESIAR